MKFFLNGHLMENASRLEQGLAGCVLRCADCRKEVGLLNRFVRRTHLQPLGAVQFSEISSKVPRGKCQAFRAISRRRQSEYPTVGLTRNFSSAMDTTSEFSIVRCSWFN